MGDTGSMVIIGSGCRSVSQCGLRCKAEVGCKTQQEMLSRQGIVL